MSTNSVVSVARTGSPFTRAHLASYTSCDTYDTVTGITAGQAA